jgi:hypothetical protein
MAAANTTIYFAGLNTRPIRDALADRPVLVSFFDAQERPALFAEIIEDVKVGRFSNALFDSGVFAELGNDRRLAKGQKPIHIDVGAYAELCQELDGVFDFIFNVDDIRGDLARTDRNQAFLEAKGLEPVPVYHQGEDFDRLRGYASSYGRVGLGFQRPITGAKAFLDQCFEVLAAFPDCKIHGLGMTRYALLADEWSRPEWNFDTTDSATWLHEFRGLEGSSKPHGARPGSAIFDALSGLDRDDRYALTLRSYDRAQAGTGDLDRNSDWFRDSFGQCRTVLDRLADSDREELLAAGLRLAA